MYKMAARARGKIAANASRGWKQQQQLTNRVNAFLTSHELHIIRRTGRGPRMNIYAIKIGVVYRRRGVNNEDQARFVARSVMGFCIIHRARMARAFASRRRIAQKSCVVCPRSCVCVCIFSPRKHSRNTTRFTQSKDEILAKNERQKICGTSSYKLLEFGWNSTFDERTKIIFHATQSQNDRFRGYFDFNFVKFVVQMMK